MVEHIVAIDIAERIPYFVSRIEPYGYCLSLPHAQTDLPNTFDPSKVKIILVSIYQTLSQEFLQRFNHLDFIGVLGTSTKKIPLAYCQSHDIQVLNIIHYCDRETAEWVLLQIMKHFREQQTPQSVQGKKLGVIGAGAVGKEVIELSNALSMQTFYNATSPQPMIKSTHHSKEEIFQTCDVVTFHTPPQCSWLTADLLKQAKKNLCLINTCMGPIAPPDVLETFLHNRPDITLIMDDVAGDSYPKLANRAAISAHPAFLTIDAEKKLVDKFFNNLDRMIKKNKAS